MLWRSVVTGTFLAAVMLVSPGGFLVVTGLAGGDTMGWRVLLAVMLGATVAGTDWTVATGRSCPTEVDSHNIAS